MARKKNSTSKANTEATSPQNAAPATTPGKPQAAQAAQPVAKNAPAASPVAKNAPAPSPVSKSTPASPAPSTSTSAKSGPAKSAPTPTKPAEASPAPAAQPAAKENSQSVPARTNEPSPRKQAQPSSGGKNKGFSFSVQGFRTSVGQNIKVVGNTPELGNWDVNKGVALKWENDEKWSGTLDLPSKLASKNVEYKYVVINGDGTQTWSNGNNFSATLNAGESKQDQWV